VRVLFCFVVSHYGLTSLSSSHYIIVFIVCVCVCARARVPVVCIELGKYVHLKKVYAPRASAG